MSGDQTDAARLAEALNRLGLGVSVTLVRTGKGFQAARKVEAGFVVDIRDNAFDALLVAVGAVPTLEMNRREKDRRIASLQAQAEAIGRRLTDEDLDLLG